MRSISANRGEQGASLLIALLLLLVCTVASSLVISAGSVVPGMMGSMPEMDARYYSVKSATKLLCSEFPASREVVLRRRDGGSVTVSSEPDDGTLPSLLTALLVYGAEKKPIGGAEWEMQGGADAELSLEIGGHDELAASVSASFDGDGTVVLDVSNDNGDTNVYTQRITFSYEVTEDVVEYEEVSTDADGNMHTSVVEVKTVTVDWRVADISDGR